MMDRCLWIVPIFLSLGCAGGGGDFGDWRGSVERYVREQGRGDPVVLRQIGWPQSQRSFGSPAGADPAPAQDSRGLLLSVETIGMDPWMIFIVGSVNRNVVQDIRVMALRVQNGQFDWRTSEPNPQAFQAYRNHYANLFKQRFLNRSDVPLQYTTFPKETDVFNVQRQGGRVVVQHPASGAMWELQINPTSPQRPDPRLSSR
jgi:hypothetical protein